MYWLPRFEWSRGDQRKLTGWSVCWLDAYYLVNWPTGCRCKGYTWRGVTHQWFYSLNHGVNEPRSWRRVV